MKYEPDAEMPEVESPHAEMPDVEDLGWSSDEVAPFTIWDRAIRGDRFLLVPNFYGHLIQIKPVGPPGEMEYLMDAEDLRRRGFIITPEDEKNAEIGRRQTYDLHFISDHGALISIHGFRAGARADGKIEPLLFQAGMYPQDLRPLREGAGID